MRSKNLLLTSGAVIAGALPNNDMLDGGIANCARFVLTTVHV